MAEIRVELTGELRVAGPGADTVAAAAFPGRQGRLLFAQLVTSRRPVHRDELAETLWPAGRPPNWRRDLSVLVSRLRTLMDSVGVDGAGALVFTRGCYELRLPPGAVVDIQLADELADAAASALRDGDVEQALEAATTAIEISRRPLLPDEDAPWIVEQRARLERAGLAALDAAAEAERRRGELRRGLAYASEAVGLAPFGERAYAALMRLQLAAGERAEALRTYGRCRRLLAEELGVNPAPATEAVFLEALRAGAAPAGPPVPGSDAEAATTNLPASLTSFVGREEEMERLAATLARARLVTVCGFGGVGKSRLAVECAARLAADHRDGAWQCELSRVSGEDAVVPALVGALGVPEGASRTLQGSLVDFLRSKQLLLLVDGCEHVLDGVARVLDVVLGACREVRVLATSRERLAVAGEHVLSVEPLPVPASVTEALASSRPAAVQLFCDRAAAACHQFAVTVDNAAAVAEICRRLDGLPLAIELAAARLRTMSVHELAEGLDHRFRLLTGGPRLASPRQRTLRATVEWSYGLLPTAERRAFDHLGVFAGTFDAEAAAAVCAAPLETAERLLEGLADRSMIMAATRGPRARFTLLETLRVYAQEQLEARGAAQAAQRRHADHYLALTETAAVWLCGPDEAEAAATLDADWAELRSAHRWAIVHGSPIVALRLGAALYWWALFRMSAEAPAWAAEAAALPGAQEHPLFPLVAATAGVGCWMRGDLDAATAFGRRGLAAAAGAPSRRFPLDVLGAVALFEGRLDDALHDFGDAAAAAAEAGDDYHRTHLLGDVALVHAYQGEPDQAQRAADEARRIAHATANPSAIAWALYVDGEIRLGREPDAAAVLLDSSVELARSVGSRFVVGVALVSASSMRARDGDPKLAVNAFRQVIEHWHVLGNWTQQWTTLRSVIELLVRLEAYEPAAMLLGAMRAADTAAPAYGPDAARLDAARRTIEHALGAPGFAAVVRCGEVMTPDQAVALACTQLETAPGVEHA